MPKRSALAKIHIAKQEMGIDEKTYRGLLWDRYRRESAADLTDRQASDLVAHFRRLGWGSRPTRGPHRQASFRQVRFIFALWQELERAGEIEHPGEESLTSFVRRMTGKENLRRLEVREASRVIESLKKWLERVSGVEK